MLAEKKCHASLAEDFVQLLDTIITYLMITKEIVKEFVWPEDAKLTSLIWCWLCFVYISAVEVPV